MNELELDLVETDESLLVKGRIFVPQEKAERLFKSHGCATRFKDEFFDRLEHNGKAWNALLGNEGGFCRARTKTSDGTIVWVLQTAVAKSTKAHMYTEKIYKEEETKSDGLKCFLSVELERIVLFHDTVHDIVYSEVLDSIISNGFNYFILCFSCCFKKIGWNPIVALAREWIFDHVQTHKLRPLPVYTKFMYALKLSKRFAVSPRRFMYARHVSTRFAVHVCTSGCRQQMTTFLQYLHFFFSKYLFTRVLCESSGSLNAQNAEDIHRAKHSTHRRDSIRHFRSRGGTGRDSHQRGRRDFCDQNSNNIKSVRSATSSP